MKIRYNLFAKCFAFIVIFFLTGCFKDDFPVVSAPNDVSLEDTISMPSGSIKSKLLLITIQGGRGDIIKDASIGNIKSLLSSSIYSWNSHADVFTSDKASWSTLLTGSNASSNLIEKKATLFSHMKDENPLIQMYSYHRDQVVDDILKEEGFVENNILQTDQEIKEKALISLKKQELDVLFLNFSNVDEAGKQGGYTSKNNGYVDEIEKVDQAIGEIIAVIKERENKFNEKWMVVITSNKGGGENLSDERNSFVLYKFPNRRELEFKKPAFNIKYKGSFPFFYTKEDEYQLAYTDDIAYKFGEQTDFTVEFKIKTQGSNSDNPIISNKDWGSGSNTGWLIYLNGNDIRINYKGSEASRIDIRNGPVVADNKWHHVAVVFNRKGSISIYFDGVFYLEDGDLTDRGTIDTEFPLVIGADGNRNRNAYSLGSGVSLNSYLSDIRIWKTNVNASNIEDWAFSSDLQEHPNYKDLIGYWKANNGIYNAQFLEDSSPHKLHLKLEHDVSFYTMDDLLNISQNDPTTFTPNTVDVVPNILYWMGLGLNVKEKLDLDGKIWILK